MHTEMNFELPPDLTSHLASLDKFITETILPLQHQDDNNRFFDHRREYARTDWEQGGVPRKEWEDLLSELAFLFPLLHFSRGHCCNYLRSLALSPSSLSL